MDLALPVLGATLRSLNTEAATGAVGDPALRRRLKYLGRHQGAHPRAAQEGGVFVGYSGYDRRKAHIRELDARVEALLQQQGMTESEGAGGPGVGWSSRGRSQVCATCRRG